MGGAAGKQTFLTVGKSRRMSAERCVVTGTSRRSPRRRRYVSSHRGSEPARDASRGDVLVRCHGSRGNAGQLKPGSL